MSIDKYWWHGNSAIPLATLANTKSLVLRSFLDKEVVELVPQGDVGRPDGEYVVQRYGLYFAQIIIDPMVGLMSRRRLPRKVPVDYFSLKIGKDLFVKSIPFGTVRLYPDGMLYGTGGNILGFVMKDNMEHRKSYQTAMEGLTRVEDCGATPPPTLPITTATPVPCPVCKHLTVKHGGASKFSKSYINQLFSLSYPKTFFEVLFADGHAQITSEVVIINFFPAVHIPKAEVTATTTMPEYKLPHSISTNTVIVAQVVFVDSYKITATSGGVVNIVSDVISSPGHQLVIF
jgi:hypothetical protein